MMERERLEQYKYLVKLRDSGRTNMWGAAEYMEDELGIGMDEAGDILVDWIKSFNLPQDEQPDDGR